MAHLSSVGADDIRLFIAGVKRELSGHTSLEECAQSLVDRFYREYAESAVLVRVFATVRFAELPGDNRRFVESLVARRHPPELLQDDTPVLSLLATRGARAEWNHRSNSIGHLGIPLASAAFVEEIPMIARLLKDLGVSLEGLQGDSSVLTRTIGSLSGVFFVPDARTAVDPRGRNVIAAQDFVEAHHIRTVFGFGGAYTLERSFVVLIVFCRDAVDQLVASSFVPLASILKTATMRQVAEGRFFRAVTRGGAPS